nr:helicase MOV-10-like [Aedes albopictus]
MGFPQFWIGIRKLDVKIVEKILNIVIAYIVRTVKLVKDAYPVFTGKMINLVKSLISFARQIDPRSLHVALVNVEPPRETQGPEVVASKQTHERDVSRILPEIQHDKVILSKRAKKKNKQQKAEGNQNEPPEQVETVETKSETVRPEKNRSKNRKGPAKKPKDQPRKEFEKVEVVLDVKRVTTLVRFSSEQHESEIRNPCPLCCTSFKESALERHLGHVHGTRCSLVPLLCSDIRNHVISREIFQLKLEQKSNRNGSTFVFKITNCAAVTLLLKSIYTSDGNGSLSSIFAGPGVLRMKPGFYYEDEIEVQVSDDCVQSLLVTVNPIEDVRLPYDVVEQYHIKKVSAKRTRINGTRLNLPRLPIYDIPTAVRKLNEHNFKLQSAFYGPSEYEVLCRLEEAKNRSSLTVGNYSKQVNLLNRVGAEHERHEFESYTIDRPKLELKKKFKKHKDGTTYEQALYALSIDQFKNPPSLINEDVRVVLSITINQVIEVVQGIVEYVETNAILILLEQSIPVANVVNIRFLFNSVTFQLEQQALERLAECRAEVILFPTGTDPVQHGAEMEELTSFQWINIGIASNEEQMVAVRNIVNRTSFPAPYVLFGPPGTGKSSTLVEAIGQIYLHRPQANMLVVAPSNFAANEITSRILNVIPEKHVFRYFSMRCRRNVDNIDEQILQVSNMADKEFELPFYEDIYLARIVVATLATSGRLVQAKIKEKHFSYVIVDECGSAKEITSLVAIGGLATCHDEIHASIVLAGDPKQLGPVIRNDYLKETNQSVSLLERIMTLNLYEMNHNTKGYNNRYITQLRDNFRSHQNLLNFPNNAFYAGQLRAKASPELTHWALKWPRLPNPNCPLIFHSIVGKTQRDNSSFSLFNREEAELVLDYLGDILSNDINGRQVGQCDIGVISPYAAQVLHLRMLCKDRGWQEIEIGSAEQYQGREKAVIILSTVRSRCSNVGFLSDARRLNVTITRARALLVVVGNHNTLQLDDNWKAFIRYCQGSKAFIDGGTTILTKKNEELKKREQRTKPNPAEKMGGSSSQKAKIRNAQMKGSSAQRKPYVPTSNSNSNNKSTKSNSALENHKQSGKVDLEKCDKNSKKLKSIPRPEDTKKATKTSGGKQVVNVNTKKQQGSTHAQTNNKPTKQTLPTAKGKTIYNRRKSKQTKREKSTNKAKQDVQTTDGNQQVDEVSSSEKMQHSAKPERRIQRWWKFRAKKRNQRNAQP